MSKILSVLLLTLVLSPSFILAQKKMVLRADGQISKNGVFKPDNKGTQTQINKKAVRKYFYDNNNLTDFTTILNYDFPASNYNFNFSGHEWFVQWFEAPTDMYITKAGFNVKNFDNDHSTVSLKLVKLNWTKDQILNSPVKNWGYYEATGNGANDITAFQDNPDVTGGWVDIEGSGVSSPFGSDLWSINGLGFSLEPVPQQVPNTYQWVDIALLNGDSIFVNSGDIVGVALFNDADTMRQGRVGMLANSTLGIPGFKFFSSVGWWNHHFTFDFALAVTLIGDFPDIPPYINSVDAMHNTFSSSERIVNANINDINPSGDSAGVASANLMYSIDAGTTWDSVAMTGAEPNFSGVIPGQMSGTHVDYFVTATDVADNYSESQHYGFDVLEVNGNVMSANNITSWVDEYGFHNWKVADGAWNGAFPNGNDVGSIFSEGIVWGGLVSDGNEPTVRVNGNTYNSGCSPITRLFRVRPDYESGDLTQDAADYFSISIGDVTDTDIQQLRDLYAVDWNEWPANEGALYEDVNSDGTYNPAVDIPGKPGAAQTIFIKYDDSNSQNTYGSPPIGLEISETYWSYKISEALDNTIFKKVDIVYKGTANSAQNSSIDSMYISQWADPDLGNYTDDFAGCDTTLNLGYAYNSAADADYDYVGLPTPAIGYSFLQGVSKYTGNLADSAIFNFKWRRGYKYATENQMSSFVYFASGGGWSDPLFVYNGTLEFYNLFRGKLPDPPYPSGEPFPNVVSDTTSAGTYLLAGDPVTGVGKIDGILDAPGDRRIVLANGPFKINIGDTAQVVIALIGAFGNDNLNSVSRLKEHTFDVNNFFKNGVITDVKTGSDIISSKFVLKQNYPNPFNPSTIIEYSLPKQSFVTLKIYDILGREVATLVDEKQNPGRFKVNFNADKLASGVYVYRLNIGSKKGSLIQSKKMVLLR